MNLCRSYVTFFRGFITACSESCLQFLCQTALQSLVSVSDGRSSGPFLLYKVENRSCRLLLQRVTAEYPATFFSTRRRSLKKSEYNSCYSYANKWRGIQQISSNDFQCTSSFLCLSLTFTPNSSSLGATH